VDTCNYRRQIDVKYLVTSKNVSNCSGLVSRALRYLTASSILLGGLKPEGSERPPTGRASYLSAEEHVFRCFKSPARAVQFSCVVSEFNVVPCKVPMSCPDSQ
jgi:hypothetical protein